MERTDHVMRAKRVDVGRQRPKEGRHPIQVPAPREAGIIEDDRPAEAGRASNKALNGFSATVPESLSPDSGLRPRVALPHHGHPVLHTDRCPILHMNVLA